MQDIRSSDSILWSLAADEKPKTAMWRFARSTADKHKVAPDNYAEFHSWSVNSPNEFYNSLWDFLGIIGDKAEAAFVAGKDIRDAQFFPGARLNYAENLLQNADDRIAIIAHRDDGTRRVITRRELYNQVSQLVQALLAENIGVGDRVAAIVTNDIEAIIGYLATAALGAIWSSCSPDFGPEGASDRLCQIDPKILFAVPNYSYGGKAIDVTSTITSVSDGCNLQKIILLTDARTDESRFDVPCMTLQDFVSPFQPGKIRFERLPYDAPLAILFSSGTTGKPKCIVHSAMGLLIQHKKELLLHCDLRVDERFFYFTTCGWMMWNWQVSGLALEVTLITYDGNPFYPDKRRLLDLIEEEQITVFGTSAKYIDSCNNFDLTANSPRELSSMRLILSTGSPLWPASFDYIYSKWKACVQVSSISGGTDICACFLGGNPLLPVYRGELQCSLLGLDVDTVDDDGNSVIGESGELVCRNAHLTMPLGFWGDEDGSLYHNAYFNRFPGVWAHGDIVEKHLSGGFIIQGRSDTTLNPGGVRIGTAEIYRQVEKIAEVEECIAIGQNWNGDQRVVLFVKLLGNTGLSFDLISKIKKQIREGATPRHVPSKIIAIDAIPRTRSGKVSEAAVRDTVNGKAIKNAAALANAECLELYKNIEELQR